MFTRILAKTGILTTLCVCMYLSVEVLSETRLSLSLSFDVGEWWRVRWGRTFQFQLSLKYCLFLYFLFSLFVCLKYLNFVKLDFGLCRIKSIDESENGVARR